MKKAIKRIVRGDDGRLRVIFVDLDTLQEVTDLTGYKIISAGSASEEPEPVESVDQPDKPSEIQPPAGGNTSQNQSGGGGGGALEGRRPSVSNSFPPAPPAPTQTRTRQVTTPRVEQPTPGAPFPGRPDVTQVEVPEVVGADGKRITDPVEIQRTVRDFVANNPEQAATELLSDRIIGSAKERGAEYAVSGMDPELRNSLAKMIEAAPPEIGAGLQIHSGYRDLAHQASLYADSKGSGMVAKPSPNAPHVAGRGADLSWNGMNLGNAPAEVKSWIHANAGNFGLTFPMNDPERKPFEPWHVETITGRTGQPWNPPEAPVPTGAPSKSGGSIGGGMMLGPVGSSLQPVSGVPMSPAPRSDFPARPEFIGSLPAEDAQLGPFMGRPEGIASGLPENAKGDRVGTGPFSAPSRPGVTPSFGRPEFVGSLPMKETGPFPARPGFAGALPAEDAKRGPFMGRPEFPGSLPAEDAVRGPFMGRPEFPGSLPAAESRFPESVSIPNYRDSVASGIIEEAKTPRSISAAEREQQLSDAERRSFASKSPAYFAASGLVDRTAEQVAQIARAFSGELSPDQLEALKASDPAAQKELANMMVTLENRAASKFFGGSFDKALNGSYDSINKSWAIPTTDANYKVYGGVVENFVADWYKGGYVDLVDNWNNSSYYNPNISDPSWGGMMSDPAMIGDHRFGSLAEYGPTGSWQSDRQTFANSTSRPNPSSPAGGAQAASGYGDGRGVAEAYAQRSGRDTFGTSASPGVGRSSFGSDNGGGSSYAGESSGGATGGRSSGPSPSSPAGGSRAAAGGPSSGSGGSTGSGGRSAGPSPSSPAGGSRAASGGPSYDSSPAAGAAGARS